MADFTGLIQQLSALTVEESGQLVKDLEELLGVKAPQSGGFMGPLPTIPVETTAVKTEFDVLLKAPGEKKINVIQLVRKLTGLGLKEAKELVDSSPRVVKECVSKEVAEQTLAELVAAGAVAEIQ